MCRLCQKNKKAMKSFDFTAFSGAMEGTRTPGLLIRSQSLYPAELQAHNRYTFKCLNIIYATGVFVKYILVICRLKYSIMAAKPKRRFIALFIKILC